MRVAIIGCGAAKLDHRAPARDLYTGSLFVAARRDVEERAVPYRILSARYGLVRPWDVIAPYDLTIHAAQADHDEDSWRRWVDIQGGYLGNWCAGVGWHRERDGASPYPGRIGIIEVHAGAAYVAVVRDMVRRWPLEIVLPVEGQIGERLGAYARRRFERENPMPAAFSPAEWGGAVRGATS